MKKLLFTLLITLLCSTLQAQQPKWVKNARKAVVTLNVLTQRGDTITTPAFYTDAQGTVVASYKSIQFANKAWITDVKGQNYPISRIMGFSSTYNVVRLKADMGKKKSAFLTEASALTKGDKMYLMPDGTMDEIAQVEKAGTYSYYTLTNTVNTDIAGMPALNEAGELVGIVQAPVIARNAPNYVLAIGYANSLEIHAMDANHTDLQYCSIMKQLPNDEKQAQSFLYLCNTTPENQIAYANDFIASYPNNTTGYILKAEAQAKEKGYAAAMTTYQDGLNVKDITKDELYYSRANLIYQTSLTQELPDGWNLDGALSDVREANTLNAQPIYTMLEARILYTQKNYEEAAQRFLTLTQTNLRSADMFLYAAQCRETAGADKADILALEDSAMTFYTKPYTMAAANVLWMRANTLREMERYRDAINDLNDYEHLLSGQLTDNFYYEREQMEQKVRMFAQAVSDIDQAIKLNGDEPLYYAEKASLMIRVNDVDQAMAASKKAMEMNPEMTDAYRLYAICLREKGDMAGAKEMLKKAADMGDQIAQSMLDKMQ